MAKRESEDGYVLERQLSEDCWILIKENRTPDGTVVLFTDVSEIKRREQRIQHMAHHDALTGLPNRVLFQSRVEDAIVRAERYGTTIAIACLDLDNFKNVNDSLGHTMGGRKARMGLDLRVQPGGVKDAKFLINYGKKRGVKVQVKQFDRKIELWRL